MHTYTTILLLLISTLSLLIPQTHAVHGSIQFCNEINFHGICTISYMFDLEKCYRIPDPNTNADKGSSWSVTPESMAYCRLYTGNHCDGKSTYLTFAMNDISVNGYPVESTRPSSVRFKGKERSYIVKSRDRDELFGYLGDGVRGMWNMNRWVRREEEQRRGKFSKILGLQKGY